MQKTLASWPAIPYISFLHGFATVSASSSPTCSAELLWYKHFGKKKKKKKVQFLEITLESNVDKKVSQREWKLTAVKFNETYCVPKAQAAKLNLKRCQAGKLVIGLATVLDEISRMTFLYHEIKTDGNSYAWDEKLQYLSSQLPVFLAPDLRLSGLKGNLPSPAQGWSQPLQVTERYTKGLFPDTVFIANGYGKGERAKQSP